MKFLYARNRSDILKYPCMESSFGLCVLKDIIKFHTKIARQINIFNILQMLVSLTAVRPNKPNFI